MYASIPYRDGCRSHSTRLANCYCPSCSTAMSSARSCDVWKCEKSGSDEFKQMNFIITVSLFVSSFSISYNLYISLLLYIYIYTFIYIYILLFYQYPLHLFSLHTNQYFFLSQSLPLSLLINQYLRIICIL